MNDLTEQDIDDLAVEEQRNVRFPEGAVVEIATTRHHWLVVEECHGYGWSLEEIAELTLSESKETGRNLSECFGYVLAYIQADARHVLGTAEEETSSVPLLPNVYEPRDID